VEGFADYRQQGIEQVINEQIEYYVFTLLKFVVQSWLLALALVLRLRKKTRWIRLLKTLRHLTITR